MPTFPPPPSILPWQWLLARATRRIVVAALYVDLGEEERALVALLDRSLEANKVRCAVVRKNFHRSHKPLHFFGLIILLR